jgi:hypothetical protein
MSSAVDRAHELLPRGVSIESSRDMLRKALLACGIGSSAVYVAANVAGHEGHQGLHHRGRPGRLT